MVRVLVATIVPVPNALCWTRWKWWALPRKELRPRRTCVRLRVEEESAPREPIVPAVPIVRAGKTVLARVVREEEQWRIHVAIRNASVVPIVPADPIVLASVFAIAKTRPVLVANPIACVVLVVLADPIVAASVFAIARIHARVAVEEV